jgi:cation:H+ antiporter
MMAGSWLIKALSNISEFLGWKKFTVAFIVMSVATASPELFIGISSAIQGIPELSLGNIVGQNIIHFTVAIFVLVFIRGSFSVKSPATKTAAFFAAFMAVFPLILVLDGSLSRIDGLILIILFLGYVTRLVNNSKKREKIYDEPDNAISESKPLMQNFSLFIKNTGILLMGIIILFIAAQGIISSAKHFVDIFDIPLVIMGAVIVSLGTALPELYFSALAAKKGETELMAGNLLGSVVVSTSLVLGITSLISPINNITLYSYASSRIFLFISVCLFIAFIWSDKKITRGEAWVLLGIYLAFIATETLF